MICKDYNCIFVHIPKTAGQSIEHFFLNLVGLTWETREPLTLKYNEDPSLGPERLSHLTAEEYVSCGHVSEAEFSKIFKFSFVRNPWSRLVSEYLYRKYNMQFSFKEFVMEGFPKPSLSNDYRHVMSQSDFVYDHEGNLLVDFIGKFERLQPDFDLVCQKIGIENSTLPHVNSTKTPKSKKLSSLFPSKGQKKKLHYTEYYDEEAKEAVAEIYKRDIELFDYKFGE
jgi:hypothetical protein